MKKASDAHLERAELSCERWTWGCGAFVVFGVALEVAIAFANPAYGTTWEHWGPVAADFLVAIGVAGEVIFARMGFNRARELQGRTSDRLSEANDRLTKMEFESGVMEETIAKAQERAAELGREIAVANDRAAKADLSRVELEAKLLPRMLNQDQWDFIQGLRGKFADITIAYETDAETRWFAGQIRDAFFSAGMRVGMVARAAEVHSTGILIYEPKGFDGSRARTVEPLVELFRRADTLPAVAVIAGGFPADIALAITNERSEIRPLMDVPAIIIGGRFVLPPPHIEKAAKAAKTAMDKTRNAGETRESYI